MQGSLILYCIKRNALYLVLCLTPVPCVSALDSVSVWWRSGRESVRSHTCSFKPHVVTSNTINSSSFPHKYRTASKPDKQTEARWEISPKVKFFKSLQKKKKKKKAVLSFSKLQCGRKKGSLASIAQCIRMSFFSLLYLNKNDDQIHHTVTELHLIDSALMSIRYI